MYKKLTQIKKNDIIKEKFATNNNINLCRISYKDNINDKLNKVIEKI